MQALSVAAANVLYLWLARLSAEKRRAAGLLITVAANLAFLGFFKYFNFFVDSANLRRNGRLRPKTLLRRARERSMPRDFEKRFELVEIHKAGFQKGATQQRTRGLGRGKAVFLCVPPCPLWLDACHVPV